MEVSPYLSFEGRCEEAIEHYRKALGAEVEMMMRYRQAPPNAGIPPGTDPDWIMHATLLVGGKPLFLCDAPRQGGAGFRGIHLSVNPESETAAERIFKALAEGGKVQMPMSETFFASRFGMTADKFGVGWMVIVHRST